MITFRIEIGSFTQVPVPKFYSLLRFNGTICDENSLSFFFFSVYLAFVFLIHTRDVDHCPLLTFHNLGIVEDEFHFILICPFYICLHVLFLENITGLVLQFKVCSTPCDSKSQTIVPSRNVTA